MSEFVSAGRLERVMKAGHLGVTSECGPPRGTDPGRCAKKAC